MEAIGTYAVPVIRCSFPVIDDIQALDKKTRSISTANGIHHPKADIDRLYVSRKKGG